MIFSKAFENRHYDIAKNLFDDGAKHFKCCVSGFALITKDGILLGADAEALKLLGISASVDHLPGLNLRDQIHQTDHDAFDAYLADAVKQGRAGGGSFFLKGTLNTDKALRICMIKLSPTELDKEIFFLILSDSSAQRQLQKALQVSEESFHMIVNSSPVGIFKTRADGEILFVNDQLAHMSGYADSTEILRLGKAVTRYAYPAQRDQLIAQLRENGRVSAFSATLIRKDGSFVDVLISAVMNDDILIGFLVDDSEQKEQLQAIQKSVSLLNATLESTADGILVVSLDGKVAGFNQTFLEMWGIPKELSDKADDEALLGYVLDQLIDPDEFLGKVMYLYNNPKLESTDQIIFKDGRVFKRYSRPQMIHDEPVGRVWSFRDITASKKAQLDLQASESKYRSLFEASADCICVISPELKLISMNPAGMAINGLKTVDDYENFDLFVNLVSQKNELEKAFNDAFDGLSCSFEYMSRNLSGALIIWDSKITPLRDEQGNISAVLRVSRDVTAKKELERSVMIRERIESLGVLAGGIAHDFNNILTGILGNVSIVKDKLPGSAADEHEILGEAELACIRAHKLTKQLLTFARGGTPLKQSVNLNVLITETCDFTVTGSNCQCQLDLPPLPMMLTADEGQISQVLSSIMINARQAMPEGGAIKVTARELPNNSIEILIKDAGAGIKKEHLPRIFEPYFSTKDTGSGLGLAIAYSVIKSHDGTISARSARDGGAEFVITLPQRTGEDPIPETAPLPIVNKFPVSRLRRMRVLVMDDDPLIRELLTNMLEHLGYTIETASDGWQTLSLFESSLEEDQPYDLVILDLLIPGSMGGKEIISKLLELHPKVKAIVSSGYSDNEVMSDYERYGFKAVIPKPYNMHELRATIQNVLAADEN